MEWYQILLLVLLILLVLCLLVILGSYLTYLAVFYSSKNEKEDAYDLQLTISNDEEKKFMISLIDEIIAKEYEEVSITSYDGLKLFARYYHVSDDSPLQIQFHGYKGMAYRDMCGGNKLATEEGFNTLVVDQRSRGNSGGHSITFGIKESKDCVSWINYCKERFKDKDIYLVGVSMGGSTVLLASQYELPSNVKAIIADCPFSSPKDIIKKVVKDRKLPVKIVYSLIKLGARLFAKIDINDGNISDAIKKCKVPVLIIHGKEDELVPCYMSQQIYENNKEKVRLEIFEEATHGLSFIKDLNRYKRVVKEFIDDVNNTK